jgi:hypothetical protein
MVDRPSLLSYQVKYLMCPLSEAVINPLAVTLLSVRKDSIKRGIRENPHAQKIQNGVSHNRRDELLTLEVSPMDHDRLHNQVVQAVERVVHRVATLDPLVRSPHGGVQQLRRHRAAVEVQVAHSNFFCHLFHIESRPRSLVFRTGMASALAPKTRTRAGRAKCAKR